MSAVNRYRFTKNLYKDYVIILVKKNKYYSFDKDKDLLEYIKFKDKLYILRKKKINYLILDELDIIEKYEYQDNQLNRYLYMMYIDKILKNMKIIMSYKYDLL